MQLKGSQLDEEVGFVYRRRAGDARGEEGVAKTSAFEAMQGGRHKSKGWTIFKQRGCDVMMVATLFTPVWLWASGGLRVMSQRRADVDGRFDMEI